MNSSIQPEQALSSVLRLEIFILFLSTCMFLVRVGRQGGMRGVREENAGGLACTAVWRSGRTVVLDELLTVILGETLLCHLVKLGRIFQFFAIGFVRSRL
jgi:hypothetical protein